jgi:hypothetical protein
MAQQNSVYPSQQSEPHWQLLPRQLQTAAYADFGRSRRSPGAVTNADPTTADLAMKLRRSRRLATASVARDKTLRDTTCSTVALTATGP